MPGKARNRVGERYGKLVILEVLPAENGHERKAKCQCDCGNIVEYNLGYLTSHIRSCGCDSNEEDSQKAQARAKRNAIIAQNKKMVAEHGGIVGCRFGRLEVMYNYGKTSYECRCDCGKTVVVPRFKLMSGGKKSCGCLSADKAYERRIIDGATLKDSPDRRLYYIRLAMLGRCYNQNAKNYADYGGRGITVCDEWRDSWQAFKEWAHTSGGYSDGLTIDRIDVNGNYCPENCRFITQKQQTTNTRRTIHVEYEGQQMALSEFCETVGISYSCAHHAYVDKGVTSPDEFLAIALKAGAFKPDSPYLEKMGDKIDRKQATRMMYNTHRSGVMIDFWGDLFNLAQFARLTGISYKRLYRKATQTGVTDGVELIRMMFGNEPLPQDLAAVTHANPADSKLTLQLGGQAFTIAQFAETTHIPVAYVYLGSARGRSGEDIVADARKDGFREKTFD